VLEEVSDLIRSIDTFKGRVVESGELLSKLDKVFARLEQLEARHEGLQKSLIAAVQQIHDIPAQQKQLFGSLENTVQLQTDLLHTLGTDYRRDKDTVISLIEKLRSELAILEQKMQAKQQAESALFLKNSNFLSGKINECSEQIQATQTEQRHMNILLRRFNIAVLTALSVLTAGVVFLALR